MAPDKDAFMESIGSYDQFELLQLISGMYDRIYELEVRETVNAQVNTETYLEYQKLCQEKSRIEEECETLKVQLQKAIEKNDLLNRSIYGRATEKFMDSLNAVPAEIIEDESQTEDNGSEGNTDVHVQVIDFNTFRQLVEASEKETDASPSNADEPEGEHKSDEPSNDGQDSDHSGSSKHEHGNSGKKKHHGKTKGRPNLWNLSVKDLPQELSYLIDIDALDAMHGKGNWRIAFWNKTETVEKMPVRYFLKVVFTPVLSIGLDHHLAVDPRPEHLIHRSLVSPSLMADILYRKFILSLPFYRLAKDFAMEGLLLSRQTMIKWTNGLALRVLIIVYQYLFSRLVRMKCIQSDETYIQVNKDGRKPGSKSFMWVHCSSELLDCPPIIIFSFEKTRGTDHLRKYFKEFSGYLTSDAYISYQVMEKENPDSITVSGCFMHCRRYFAIALFIHDLQDMTDEEIAAMPETTVLFMIREIYAAEKPLKDLSTDERLKARKTKVAPKVDRFFDYVHKLVDSHTVFSDRMQEALTYAVNQEKRLRLFLTNGDIPIDNGHCERIISSYSIGRANWKFADTIRGAEANAVVYSLVETAKANHANPRIYLQYLFEVIPPHLHDDGTIDDKALLPDLTPWSEAYKAYAKLQDERTRELCRDMFPIPEKPRTPRKKDCKPREEGSAAG